MLKTVEATIDENGHVTLREPVRLARSSRALLTILDDSAVEDMAVFTQAALADWNRSDEDEAWEHLQERP
jgi:hypothetical protein